MKFAAKPRSGSFAGRLIRKLTHTADPYAGSRAYPGFRLALTVANPQSLHGANIVRRSSVGHGDTLHKMISAGKVSQPEIVMAELILADLAHPRTTDLRGIVPTSFSEGAKFRDKSPPVPKPKMRDLGVYHESLSRWIGGFVQYLRSGDYRGVLIEHRGQRFYNTWAHSLTETNPVKVVALFGGHSFKYLHGTHAEFLHEVDAAFIASWHEFFPGKKPPYYGKASTLPIHEALRQHFRANCERAKIPENVPKRALSRMDQDAWKKANVKCRVLHKFLYINTMIRLMKKGYSHRDLTR